MGSAKKIMTLWVIWKKPIVLLIDLDPEEGYIGVNTGDKGKPAPPVGTSPQEIDEEMKKSRPLVKNKLNEWHDWLVDYIPKSIKNAEGKAFLRAKNSIQGLYDGVKKTLKGDVGIRERQKTIPI